MKIINNITMADKLKFYSLIDIREENECWEYLGYCDKDGYGKFQFQGFPFMAHRIAWSIENGNIPYDLIIRHECDNPPCCNPNHLLVGTVQDNTDDAYNRGRRDRADKRICIPNDILIEFIWRAYENGEAATHVAKELGYDRRTITRQIIELVDNSKEIEKRIPLSNSITIQIIQEILSGKTQQHVADKFHISRARIYRIMKKFNGDNE